MKFNHMSICDLRKYNAFEAASQIESVSHVSLLILPENSDAQTQAAFAKIKMQHIGATITAADNVIVTTCNGSAELTQATCPDDVIVVVNGSAKIHPISPEKSVSLVVNGSVLYHFENNVNLLAVNGSAEAIDFNNTDFMPVEFALTANMLTDPKKCYYGQKFCLIHEVGKEASGKVLAKIVVAHESVQESKVKIEAKHVRYIKTETNIVFKRHLGNLNFSKDLLEQIEGKLVLSVTGNIKFEKQISPELLREKILLIDSVGNIHAPKKLHATLNLLTEIVGRIHK